MHNIHSLKETFPISEENAKLSIKKKRQISNSCKFVEKDL